MGACLAADRHGYWYGYGGGFIALKRAGREESRAILGASDSVVSIDISKAEKAADIVFLTAGLPVASGTDSSPDEFGDLVGPRAGWTRSAFSSAARLMDGRAKKSSPYAASRASWIRWQVREASAAAALVPLV